RLSKGYDASDFDAWLQKLLPLYVQVIQQLQQEGVQWVQIDEPVLVTKWADGDAARLRKIYETITVAAPKVKVMLQTYFEAVEHYDQIIQLPVHGIGLDFVHGYEENVRAIQTFGFPENKVLGAGIIDGRGIWKASL